MADIGYENNTTVALQEIMHITAGQVGTSMVIKVTHEGEEEDGEVIILRSPNTSIRNQALEGLYKAFKKRRRDYKKPSDSNKPTFR